ncbi:MAG: class I SAM-dependent methyltransferase [Bdellovibrionales bacterium]|nr:class I SAM-dependent methyltransferase [Bdellovibrionales bacterium]
MTEESDHRCPLCLEVQAEVFARITSAVPRLYYRCSHCDLVFLDISMRLSPEEEKARYLLHQNDLSSSTYRKYLQKMVEPIVDRQDQSKSRVLDYGCGPTRGIWHHWGNDFQVDSYDPLFFPCEFYVDHVYDFILCSEAAEHFYRPHLEWSKMAKLLKSGGWIILRTAYSPQRSEDFENWYYHRDPTHVCFYSPQSVDWIRKNFSLKIHSLLSGPRQKV